MIMSRHFGFRRVWIDCLFVLVDNKTSGEWEVASTATVHSNSCVILATAESTMGSSLDLFSPRFGVRCVAIRLRSSGTALSSLSPQLSPSPTNHYVKVHQSAQASAWLLSAEPTVRTGRGRISWCCFRCRGLLFSSPPGTSQTTFDSSHR